MPEPETSGKPALDERLGKPAERPSVPTSRPATPYDTLPEESFDRVARLAAGSLRAPVAIVSLAGPSTGRRMISWRVRMVGNPSVTRFCPDAP